jgi:putative drug exporter of the RND superfamily
VSRAGAGASRGHDRAQVRSASGRLPRLERLGRSVARHRWLVLATWIVAAVVVVMGAQASGGRPVDVFSIPGAQSQHALDLLKQRFPTAAGDTATVVFTTEHGTLRTPSAQAAIAATAKNLQALPRATSVVAPEGPLAAALVSKDGTIAFARVQYDTSAQTLGTGAFHRLVAAAQPARAAGLGVQFGGPVVDYGNQSAHGNGDAIGLLVAIVILLLAFGSVIAMGLPIGTALFGLAVGLSLITVLASVTQVGTVAPEMGTMIGLGVGIDYSLFVVTRYREALATGLTVEAAIGRALATAGQAVLFAGSTVVIALCGLQLSGIPYVAVLGFTAAIVVAVMIVAALTLLPALMAVAGRGIDRLRVPGLRSSIPQEGTTAHAHGFARWARFVARHPWPLAIACLALLLTLAYPVTQMRLGQTDDGSAPASSTQRKAYDLLAQGFGPGANGPLLLAVALPTPGDTTPIPAITRAVTGQPGVAAVSPAQVSPDHTTAVISVEPTTRPDSAATSALVNRLRRDVLPPVIASTKARVFVGGETAAYIDLGDRISSRLPWFILAVVGLSFLLLMAAFRSLVIPLTAAVMNLLSIGAAYGVVVAVFQFGWGKELLGLHTTVPIVSFVPMMMFAILFGLSMDYQVFLLTRVREEYEATGQTREAVVGGLATTARVITSAALIMISVFLSFVATPAVVVQMFGVGLAVAVLVDASVVRMVLVPATMELLGAANWWLPRSLDRILPRISLEGGGTGTTRDTPDVPAPESPEPVGVA